MGTRKAYLAHVCNQINHVSDQVKNWLANQPISILDYDSLALSRRLTQKIVDTIYNPILRAVAWDQEARPESFPAVKHVMKIGGITIETSSGETSVSTRQVARHIYEFCLHWFYLLFRILKTFFDRGGRRELKATLLYGVGSENISVDGNDRRFLEYCYKGPIRPLNDADILIVQSVMPIKGTEPEKVFYRRFPEIDLLDLLRIDWWEGISLLFGHIRLFFVYMYKVLSNPLLSLLGRDIANEMLIRWLNDRGEIKDVIITNSSYSRQFLWMYDLPGRKYTLHQLWYSMNNKPIVYRSEPLEAIVPGIYCNVSDELWVWTESQKEYFEKIMVGHRFHVVGPILWYLNTVSEPLSSKKIRIALFDVTPVNDAWARNYGIIYNYYSPENMRVFIKDTIDVIREIFHDHDVEVVLKHKRPPHSIHDDRYFSLIEGLLSKVPYFKVVPPASNMFELLSGCDMAIVVPFSSPAYVASFLGIPAIYFDPVELLDPSYESDSLVSFASGRKELSDIIESISNKKITRTLSQ